MVTDKHGRLWRWDPNLMFWIYERADGSIEASCPSWQSLINTSLSPSDDRVRRCWLCGCQPMCKISPPRCAARLRAPDFSAAYEHCSLSV
jgi:hypothetical protein